MEAQNRNQHLLQLYAERGLQGDDLAEFKHLAQTVLEFRREAELERRIAQAIQRGQRERLRQTFDQFHADMLAEEAPTGRVVSLLGRSVPMRWAAAAAVVLVLGLGVLMQQLTQPGEPNLAQTGQRVTIEQQEITPAFGFAGADSVQTSTEPFVLYTGPADRPQYSFADDTLRLYGAFRPNALTLIIRRPANGPETYQLRVKDVLYPLNRLATEPTLLRP